MRWGALCFVLLMTSPLVYCSEGILDGKMLQAQLDAGSNVALNLGQVIEINESLNFRKPGQRIETVGAKSAKDYARIVMADGAQGKLVDAHGVPGAVLSKVILDGNRPGFRTPDGKLTMEPMLSFGGEGAIGQEIRNCIVLSGRCAGGWGAIHVQEGGQGIIIRDNVIFGAGADIRGNGRSPFEKPFGWGDGISTASRDTLVLNNLIYDATDEGIMLQGAPGTTVRSNVIVAVSREMLGGIALVDPFKHYELDAAEKTYDYKGILIEDNLILAEGGRVHIGVPMGGAPWNAFFERTTLVGAQVRNNHISGSAGGYGFLVDGVDAFEVQGNTSDAVYSGVGDGKPGLPPDAPMAFMVNPATMGGSRLQDDFVPMKNSLTAALRASRTPKDSRNPLGYRDQPYPDAEVKAVVNMAFVEMLGRDAQAKELAYWTKWLQETRSNADTLRRNLMTTWEFVQVYGYVDPLDLHTWRNERWLKMILKACSDFQANGADWPSARALNEKLIGTLRSDDKQ